LKKAFERAFEVDFKVNSSEFGVDPVKVCNWKILIKTLQKLLYEEI